ncbi:MAG: hypothetical protein LCH32_01050 [Bacteroidetes bacterium]|jgi:uncharacterized membrane protein YfcA|nr:hypothetical protein [Bacteroidota bacterium]MCA0429069.1 hypothetical protein [Bacteroidota bacterium]
MREKTIVSTVTLAASLISYFYAKETQKDTIPFVMIGGFMGAVIGEVIVGAIKSSKNNQDKKED